MRPKLFGKAPPEFTDESRCILQIAMRPKLQIAFYQIKQQLRRTRPGLGQLARYLPVSLGQPDGRLELFVLRLECGVSVLVSV